MNSTSASGRDRALRPDVQPRWWVAGPNSGGYHWGPLWNRWYATNGGAVRNRLRIKYLQELLKKVQSADDFEVVRS